MKKVLSILMAGAILVTSLFIPAFAEATSNIRDINDYLTIHYDFEGSSQAKRLQDKASAGSSADTLRFDTGDDGRFTFANGTVASTSVSNPTLIADASADIKQANEGTGTWFMRFRLNETPTYDVCLLNLRNTATSRAFNMYISGGKLYSSTSKGTAPSSYVSPFIGTMSYDTVVGEWVNLFAVRRIDDAGKYAIYFYYGLGDPTGFAEYTYMGRFVVGTVAEGLASSESLPLNLFSETTSAGYAAKFELDDLRYYNTDLTNDEIGSLVRNGNFCWSVDRDINDFMTIHYDFEGEDYLKDKASVGVADDLTFATGDSTGFEITNGAISAVSNAKNLLQTKAPSRDTFEANTGKGTWFLRVKASELTGDAPIIDFRLNGTSRPFSLTLEKDGQFSIAASKGGANKNTYNASTNYPCMAAGVYDFETSPWLNIVAVRTIEDNGSGVDCYFYRFYHSIGNSTKASDWVFAGRFMIGTVADGLASADGVNLGLFQQPTQGWALVPGLTIDDVRYYDTDLTVAEIATILSSATVAEERSEFIGYQVSEIYEKNGVNCYKLRLVGEIDSRDYTEAGLRLTVTVGNESYTTDNSITTVFTSLLTNYGKGTYTAPEGKYIFAIVITDIPEDIFPTIAATTYAKTADACYFGGNPANFTVSASDFVVSD